jgi:hypothetical protein
MKASKAKAALKLKAKKGKKIKKNWGFAKSIDYEALGRIRRETFAKSRGATPGPF